MRKSKCWSPFSKPTGSCFQVKWTIHCVLHRKKAKWLTVVIINTNIHLFYSFLAIHLKICNLKKDNIILLTMGWHSYSLGSNKIMKTIEGLNGGHTPPFTDKGVKKVVDCERCFEWFYFRKLSVFTCSVP